MGTELILANAEKGLELGVELAKLIREKNLVTKIAGKEYIGVEGWQYAGARLGVVPIIKEVSKIQGISNEIKYGSWCELTRIDTGQIIGRGYGVCSNLEPNKRAFLEYAICSMAQTRSIGKAYRSIIGWIVKCQGFEGTSAEEMDGVELLGKKQPPPPQEEPVMEIPSRFFLLDKFKEAKKLLGEEKYYEILNGYQYDKSDKIPPEKRDVVLAELRKQHNQSKETK